VVVRDGEALLVCAHNEIMRHGHTVGQFLQSVVALLVTVAFSPLVVVAGEPVSHYVLARPVAGPTRLGWHRVPRRSGVAMFSYGQAGTVHVFWRRHSFWMVLVSNPLWIALTAPARWLRDRVSGFGRRGWRGPPAAGGFGRAGRAACRIGHCAPAQHGLARTRPRRVPAR